LKVVSTLKFCPIDIEINVTTSTTLTLARS